MSLTITSPRDLTGQIIRAGRYSFACGGSADIYKAYFTYRDQDQFPVAVKVLNGFQDLETLIRRLCREVQVWETLKHPNVVPFFGISFDFDRPDMPCMVSPWLSNGNIIEFLKKGPDFDKLVLIKDIASGLSYLHGQFIVHGDVKGSNILINDSSHACLSDFGRSRFSAVRATRMTDLGDITMSNCIDENYNVDLFRILEMRDFTSTKTTSAILRCPTPELGLGYKRNDFSTVTTEGWRWIACELMADSLDENRDWISRVTMATDVWSFSMTVIEILTGSIPFSHIKNDANIILSVTSGGRPRRELCPQINDDIWAMLERCWDADPTQRPSMDNLSQFFTALIKPAALERSRL